MTKQTDKRNFAKTGSFLTQAQEKNSWVHYADSGTTLEDVQRPNYWCNVAGRMLLYDRVEVVFPALNAVADFVVLSIEDVSKHRTPNRSAQSAKLKLIQACNFPQVEESQELSNDVYSAKFSNHIKKWTVINGLNNAVVEEGISTKEEAQEKANALNAQNA